MYRTLVEMDLWLKTWASSSEVYHHVDKEILFNNIEKNQHVVQKIYPFMQQEISLVRQ
jgi:hypothetical protein